MDDSNPSAVVKTQHGVYFQKLITTLFCLANIKEIKRKTLGFKITPEDNNSGKFDDIRYEFWNNPKENTKNNIFLVQVKHKKITKQFSKQNTKEPHTIVPTIKLNEFISNTKNNKQTNCGTNSSKKPFNIQTYFTSFYDLKLPSDKFLLILCTNRNIDSKAKLMWKLVKEHSTSLDNHMLGIFKIVKGECYQLDRKKRNSREVTQTLTNLFRECSESARLAKLLVKHVIFEKNEINSHISLFAKYRNAILKIIEKTDNGQEYKFKKNISTNLGKIFRNEFIKTYQCVFGSKQRIKSVFKDLETKTILVAEAYVRCTANSEALFPNDQVKQANIQSFFEHFRLVCGIKSSHELRYSIEHFLRRCNATDEHDSFPTIRIAEDSMAVQKIYEIVNDYIVGQLNCSIVSNDIIECLDYIEFSLKLDQDAVITQYNHFNSISDYRIDETALKESTLRNGMENNTILILDTYNTIYGATMLLDITKLQGKKFRVTLFLGGSEYSRNPIMCVGFCKFLRNFCLIINNGAQLEIKYLEDIAKKEFENCVFLINETTNKLNDTTSQIKNENAIPRFNTMFHIKNLSEKSWNWFFNEDKLVSLCDTFISPVKIFKNDCELFLVEDVMEQIDRGKQMKQNSKIMKNYTAIETSYVHRCLKKTKENGNQFDCGNGEDDLSEISKITSTILEKDGSVMSTERFLDEIKVINHLFENTSTNKQIVQESQPNGEDNKVEILLDEKGRGKSTYLIWLARHLYSKERHTNNTPWVILCNLSHHLTGYESIKYDQNRADGKSPNFGEIGSRETTHLKMLYKLACLSHDHTDKLSENSNRNNALSVFSDFLTLSQGKIKLEKNLETKITLENMIQLLVFQEKFNSGALVLLFDGLDDIQTCDRNEVLKLLSGFAEFDGVRNLFLISRNMSNDDERKMLRQSFKDPTLYELQPLSLKQTVSILHKMLQFRFESFHIDAEAKPVFFKVLSLIIMASLGEKGRNLKELKNTLDIFEELPDRYVNKKGIINVRKLREIKKKVESNRIQNNYNSPKTIERRRSF